MTDLVVIKQNEEEALNAIIASEGENLPAMIPDILPILSFTHLKAQTYRNFVQQVKKIEDQKELHQAALVSGQRYAQAALYAEARLGEMLENTKLIGRDIKGGDTSPNGMAEKQAQGGVALEDVGVSKHQSEVSQIIAKAKDSGIMEKVFKEAEEKGDIPSKSKVITAYKAANYIPKKPAPIPDIGQFARTIKDSLGGLRVRVEKMAAHKDQVSQEVIGWIIRDAQAIVDALKEEVDA